MIYTSEITVKLVQQVGNDQMIIDCARVSTGSSGKDSGLIGYLMKQHHGSPFECGFITFFVDAPIFVWREHHRHRVGWSFNETSGRYRQLEPKFWIPSRDRATIPVPDPGDKCPDCNSILVKISGGVKECNDCKKTIRYHHSARPMFIAARERDYNQLVEILENSYQSCYASYESLIAIFAKEVARALLPVAIYSQCYTSCNPRSLMHFLSLRTHREEAKFVSYPQKEIERVAEQYERIFEKYWPITWTAFNDNGRVAP